MAVSTVAAHFAARVTGPIGACLPHTADPACAGTDADLSNAGHRCALAREVDLISIEASDLQADPGGSLF